MNVKFELKPISEIFKNHNLGNEADKFLRDEVDRCSDPYVPFSQGILKNNKAYPNDHSIKYNSPYARYQYYGKVMIGNPPKSVTNKDLVYNGAPKRGAKWDKRMWSDKGKSIIGSLEKFIKNGGKNE